MKNPRDLWDIFGPYAPVALVVLAVLATALALGAIDCAAEAEGDPEAALALELAKVCANEAFGSERDCVLIWNVTEGRGSTAETRLGWLRRHSPCVTGQLPDPEADARPGNCGWSRHLRWNDEQPHGWPADWQWAGQHDATWRRTRAGALRLVTGEDRRQACDGRPITWGSRRLESAPGPPPRPCRAAVRHLRAW